MMLLLCRWRCWRKGVPRELRGKSLDGIPACRWGGWTHTVTYEEA